jgi:hypothetical protein
MDRTLGQVAISLKNSYIAFLLWLVEPESDGGTARGHRGLTWFRDEPPLTGGAITGIIVLGNSWSGYIKTTKQISIKRVAAEYPSLQEEARAG